MTPRAAADPGPWAYAGTTTQLAGLFPFGAASGAPQTGVPIGRHLLTGDAVCCDPFAWHAHGLVTNLGMMVLGAPGAGKTSLAKRVIRGLIACGTRVLVLGDPKGEYTAITRSAGGQVITIGRGHDRINPLDAGPLTAVLPHTDTTTRARLHADIRAHRLRNLTALCTLARATPLADWEATLLGAALDTLTRGPEPRPQPTLADVLTVLNTAPTPLIAASQTTTPPATGPLGTGPTPSRLDDVRRVDVDRFASESLPVRRTLYGLLEGALKGVFDTATTTPVDPHAPIVCIDLSAVSATTDILLPAAMLTTWAHGHAVIDAAAARARAAGTPPPPHLAVLDEMWRALRGAPALVEHADALTRIYRHHAVAHLMLTHSLDDLAAVTHTADRAKTRGLLDRCAITALTATSDHELDQVSRHRHLTPGERRLVQSWSTAATWTGTGHHPARGRYLLKAGDAPGIPVQMHLVGDEPDLYHTDPAPHPRSQP